VQDKKQTQTKKQKQTKQETETKTSTAGGQLISSWAMESARRDDNIVSPQGLVWQCKTKRNNKPQSAIQKSVSQEATTAQCGNQGSPQPGASRSQSASRTGNILTDSCPNQSP